MGRDWVSQYTDIIAGHYLPTRWPDTITVDSFDVRIKTYDEHGNPLKHGKHLYSVITAVGYEQGIHRGQLRHVAAFPGESECWARILRENHTAHDGKPPPRRLHDGNVLVP